jgi:hypothetical protein
VSGEDIDRRGNLVHGRLILLPESPAAFGANEED